MSRWPAGHAEIERLLATRELERVVANNELADRLLSQARDHLDTARAAVDTDPTGAYQLAYDAARKACAATLATQGLRATRSGGHVAIRSAAVAQLRAARGGEALAKFDVMRRRRHEAEYPDEKADLITAAETAAAIEWAQAIVALLQAAIPHLEPW